MKNELPRYGLHGYKAAFPGSKDRHRLMHEPTPYTGHIIFPMYARNCVT
jgi:hypothetical protein